MASSKLTMSGDKELAKALKSLGPRVARKVLRQAVSAGATPVVKSAKQHVSEESGLLKKSLGKKVKLAKRTGRATARVGARTNVEGEHNGQKRVPWRYSHLVELGHIDENGNHVPAHPFLRPARDENESKSVGIISDKLAAGVVKEARNG